MPRRLVVLLALLTLCACAGPSTKKPAIDEIDRRHTEDMQRMGGLGGNNDTMQAALAGS